MFKSIMRHCSFIDTETWQHYLCGSGVSRQEQSSLEPRRTLYVFGDFFQKRLAELCSTTLLVNLRSHFCLKYFTYGEASLNESLQLIIRGTPLNLSKAAERSSD
jgi:hypothetical protein